MLKASNNRLKSRLGEKFNLLLKSQNSNPLQNRTKKVFSFEHICTVEDTQTP